MVLGFADNFISSYARKSSSELNKTVLPVEERLPHAFSAAKTTDPAVLRRAQSLSLSTPQAHRKSSMPLLSGNKFSGERVRNTKLNCQRLSEVQSDAKKDARTQSGDEKILSRVIPGHQVSWSNAKFKKGVTSREREEAIKAEKKAIEAAQKEQELVEKAAAERSRFEKAKSMRMEAKKRLEKTRALRDPNLAQNDDALGTSI